MMGISPRRRARVCQQIVDRIAAEHPGISESGLAYLAEHEVIQLAGPDPERQRAWLVALLSTT